MAELNFSGIIKFSLFALMALVLMTSVNAYYTLYSPQGGYGYGNGYGYGSNYGYEYGYPTYTNYNQVRGSYSNGSTYITATYNTGLNYDRYYGEFRTNSFNPYAIYGPTSYLYANPYAYQGGYSGFCFGFFCRY